MAAEERRMYREAVNGPLVTVNVVQWVDAADGRRLVVPLLKFGCLRCMQLMRQRHRHRFFGQRRDKASHGIFRDWEVRNYITKVISKARHSTISNYVTFVLFLQLPEGGMHTIISHYLN